MKRSFSILCLAVVVGAFSANAQVNVTQEHPPDRKETEQSTGRLRHINHRVI